MATLAVSPVSVEQGKIITCNFTGFFHNDTVYVGVRNGGSVNTISNNNGSGSVSFSLGEAPGNYIMEAWDDMGNYAETPFFVTPAGWFQVYKTAAGCWLSTTPMPTGWVEVAKTAAGCWLSDTPMPTGWFQVDKTAVGCWLLPSTPKPPGEESGMIPVLLVAGGVGLLLMGLQDSNKKQ
jgi:hypothetical protein